MRNGRLGEAKTMGHVWKMSPASPSERAPIPWLCQVQGFQQKGLESDSNLIAQRFFSHF